METDIITTKDVQQYKPGEGKQKDNEIKVWTKLEEKQKRKKKIGRQRCEWKSTGCNIASRKETHSNRESEQTNRYYSDNLYK